MPKPTAKPQTEEYLVNAVIPVPEAVAHLIDGDDKNIRIRFDGNTVARRDSVRRSLKMSRRLLRPDSIGIENPLVLALLRKYPNRKAVEVAGDVAMRYQEWHEEVDNGDSYWLALLWDTPDLLLEPLPYTAAELGGDVPKWRKDYIEVPHPPYLMTNPDERRLKQIYDFLSMAGMDFWSEVKQAVEDSIVEVAKRVDPVNASGFPT